MSTRNELLLEHRVSELELELHRLRKQVDKLATTPATQTPAPAKYTAPAERTTIHQRVRYAFEAKLPDVRRVVDFRTTNTHTGEVVNTEHYSATQIERALQKFSRLQFVSRRHWHGRNELYSVARRLFAQAGAIQQHAGSNVWHWAAWPHERRAVCARICVALSRQK